MILPLLEGAASARAAAAEAEGADVAPAGAGALVCPRYSLCSRFTDASLSCLCMTLIVNNPCTQRLVK